MEITTLGIDLAKNVFRVHGVDAHGKTVLQRQLSGGSCLRLWRSSSLAWLAWKPAGARIIGHARSAN
jgi:hypothetical protein